MLKLTVISVDPPQGSIAFGVGKTSRGVEVNFAGDYRMMLDIAEAIANGELPEVMIEAWQVL